MGYGKKIIEVGEIERRVIKCYMPMLGNSKPRNSRVKKTVEKIEKHNVKKATEELCDLLRLNFSAGDYHLAFTYRPNTVSDGDVETAELLFKKFLRKLRAYAKKSGKVCKYIWNTDISKTGKMHHHVILPKWCSISELQKMWPNGKVVFNATLWQNADFYGLAKYLIDTTKDGALPGTHTAGGKRYKCSKNLQRPKITYEAIKAKRWAKNPKAPKGWRVVPDSLFNGVDDYCGYPYQSYTMVKIVKTKRRI